MSDIRSFIPADERTELLAELIQAAGNVAAHFSTTLPEHEQAALMRIIKAGGCVRLSVELCAHSAIRGEAVTTDGSTRFLFECEEKSEPLVP